LSLNKNFLITQLALVISNLGKSNINTLIHSSITCVIYL